ncbi:MAG: hypothetical protein SWK76_06390 [Actinomycetota bacterium]|nr:hypothetical protein [Actinomycetota bacterium]
MEAASAESMELEVRGGMWEGIHAVLFYLAVTFAILATVGVMRVATGIGCVFTLFYSMFAIFSSPVYVQIDPSHRGVTVERYHYFIPHRRHIEQGDLERVTVIESSRPPNPQGEQTSGKRDLTYSVKVYLEPRQGHRLKIFRSGLSGAPLDAREKAFLVALEVSGALSLPVVYTVRHDGGPLEDT